MGSVHRPPRSCLTSLYLGLCPLQSIMLVWFGMTLLLDAADVLAGAALAALAARLAAHRRSDDQY